jgi:cysteine synthase
MMQAFGARITDVKSDNKQITQALVKEMIRTAGEINRRARHWYCDQLNNQDATAGYLSLGEEIWSQTDGAITAFVHAVSKAHSIHGVTQALWAHDAGIEIVAVEPEESAVLSGMPSALTESRRIRASALEARDGEPHRTRIDRCCQEYGPATRARTWRVCRNLDGGQCRGCAPCGRAPGFFCDGGHDRVRLGHALTKEGR